MNLKRKSSGSKKAIFLDRDGVINEAIIKNGKPFPPSNILDLKILPGVPSTLKYLKNEGWILIVITNQPDVARGITKVSKVEAINNYLKDYLPICDIFTCYHDDHDMCECRKPLPGALFNAARLYDINLSKSYMIGDRWRDVEAGRNAGCKTIYIDNSYDEKQPQTYDFRINSLTEVTNIILGDRNEENT